MVPNRWVAASEPSTSAIDTDTVMATTARASVIGISDHAASIAGRCCQIDSPKSPWAAFIRKMRNCSITGRSRPYA